MWWNDKSGKRIFNQPHIDLYRDNKLIDIFVKIGETGDDRSRVILVNLILEHLIDILLEHLIKNYDNFSKETNPSFYLKLSLLKSFDIIPEQILNSINCLREIRNRFAHKIDITNFSDLDDKIIEKINITYSETPSVGNDRTIHQKIERLEFHSIAGLDLYEPNLKLLSNFINSQEFKEFLDKTYKNKLKEQSDFLDEFLKNRKTD